MNLISRRKADEAARESDTEPKGQNMTDTTDTVTSEAAATPAVAETDPHLVQAAALKARADEIRENARAAVTETEQQLAEARATAARIVGDAQTAHNQASVAKLTADREAQEVDGIAGYHRHASSLAGQIAGLETRLAGLDDEHAGLTEQAQGLDKRLAELGLDKQMTQQNVARAIDDGDAERLAALRAKLAGTEEISNALQGKLSAIRQRLAAIGLRSDTQGATEIPTVVRRLEALRTEQERVEDAIDPQRPGAELRASLARLVELSAYAAKHPLKTPPPQTTTVAGSGNGGRTAVVRRNA